MVPPDVPDRPVPATPGASLGARRRSSRRTHVRRAVYALLGVGVVLVIGTFGFHAVANLDYVDAFYFESMLATGQGPPFPLTSDGAKLFASLMAFVSVGSVLTTVVFAFGPMVVRLWHEVAERVETEVRKVEEDLREPRQGP